MNKASPRTLSVAEVRKRLHALLSEVVHTGEPIFIRQDGHPVAVLISIEAYESFCRAPSLPVTEQVELARAAFGMWMDREDIDDEWLMRSRGRWRSEWGNV